MGGGEKHFSSTLTINSEYQVNFRFGATAVYTNTIFQSPMFVLTPMFHPNLFLFT
jgi:hypothetical protein